MFDYYMYIGDKDSVNDIMKGPGLNTSLLNINHLTQLVSYKYLYSSQRSHSVLHVHLDICTFAVHLVNSNINCPIFGCKFGKQYLIFVLKLCYTNFIPSF